jgi:hypothetical protein
MTKGRDLPQGSVDLIVTAMEDQEMWQKERCQPCHRAAVAWAEALGAALEELLQDYRLLVCQLEQSMMAGGLTLHQLWFHLQGSLHSLKLLDQLVTTIAAHQTSGGATLASSTTASSTAPATQSRRRSYNS